MDTASNSWFTKEQPLTLEVKEFVVGFTEEQLEEEEVEALEPWSLA